MQIGGCKFFKQFPRIIQTRDYVTVDRFTLARPTQDARFRRKCFSPAHWRNASVFATLDFRSADREREKGSGDWEERENEGRWKRENLELRRRGFFIERSIFGVPYTLPSLGWSVMRRIWTRGRATGEGGGACGGRWGGKVDARREGRGGFIYGG